MRGRQSCACQQGPVTCTNAWPETEGVRGCVLRRALVVRRFQSLSVQDICQFVIIGLLTGCATASSDADASLHALQACVPVGMQAALCTRVLLTQQTHASRCFWFQRGGKNTLAASQDTLGAPCLSVLSLVVCATLR